MLHDTNDSGLKRWKPEYNNNHTTTCTYKAKHQMGWCTAEANANKTKEIEETRERKFVSLDVMFALFAAMKGCTKIKKSRVCVNITSEPSKKRLVNDFLHSADWLRLEPRVQIPTHKFRTRSPHTLTVQNSATLLVFCFVLNLTLFSVSSRSSALILTCFTAPFYAIHKVMRTKTQRETAKGTEWYAVRQWPTLT